jgi:hypothetical protein
MNLKQLNNTSSLLKRINLVFISQLWGKNQQKDVVKMLRLFYFFLSQLGKKNLYLIYKRSIKITFKSGEFQMSKVTSSPENKMYVISENGGYSCLGFQVCAGRVSRLEKHFGMPANSFQIGSMEMYGHYQMLVNKAREEFESSGKRCLTELHPELKSLKGKRVEVVQYGQKERFYVGMSNGWIPTLLRIRTKSSSGGEAISFDEKFQSIRVVG